MALRCTRRANLRKLEPPDLLWADRLDPLIVGHFAAQLLSMFEFLATRGVDWDLLILRRIRAESTTPQQIRRALADAPLLWRERDDEQYLYLPITSTFMDMQSVNSRRTLRTKLNRLQRSGLTFRIVEHPENCPGLLDELAALERMRTVGREPAALMLAEDIELFRRIFDTLGPRGWLYVGVVEYSATLVAYEVGFLCGRRLWVYTKGFDPRYAHLSPGTLLTAAVIDYGFANGYSEYDMLRGQEDFKRRLSQETYDQVRFEVWNNKLRSRAAAAIYFGARVGLISAYWQLRNRPIHPDL
jgi:CelD/BcsL family acetyltransferase involved in cellulose biosynthesis